MRTVTEIIFYEYALCLSKKSSSPQFVLCSWSNIPKRYLPEGNPRNHFEVLQVLKEQPVLCYVVPAENENIFAIIV